MMEGEDRRAKDWQVPKHGNTAGSSLSAWGVGTVVDRVMQQPQERLVLWMGRSQGYHPLILLGLSRPPWSQVAANRRL